MKLSPFNFIINNIRDRLLHVMYAVCKQVHLHSYKLLYVFKFKL